MNRNPKRKLDPEFLEPDDGSMHNKNINPARRPQAQQPQMRASAVAPMAYDNNNNFERNNNVPATFSEVSTLPSTESSSSRIFSHNNGVFGQPSNPTSLSDDAMSQYQPTISNRPPQAPNIQPVLPQHRDPHEFVHQGALFPPIPSNPEDIYPVSDIADPTEEELELFSLLAEPDAPDPGIDRSDTTVAPHQQDSHQPTHMMLFQQAARHWHDFQAFCAGGSPNSEDYFPQMLFYIQQHMEAMQYLKRYADLSAQGPHDLSLSRPHMHRETAREPTELDEDEAARGEALPNGKRYRCKAPDCPRKAHVFTKQATFSRHVETQHHPRALYNCPFPFGCDQVFRRRDKVGNHCRLSHLTAPTTVDIDGNKVNIECPAICALCPRMVRNWHEFYKCFLSHCVIEDEPVDNQQPKPHHNGSGNGGPGPAHGNGSNAPASKTGGVRGTMSNEGFGGNVGHVQGRGFQSRQYNGNQIDQNQSTALDNPSFPGEANFLASPQPYPTSSMADQRRGSTDQIPPGALPHGQTFRPISHHQPMPTAALAYEELQCQRCLHTLSSCDTNCTLLNRTNGCHMCGAGIALVPGNMASTAGGMSSRQQSYLVERRAQVLRGAGHPTTGRGTHEHGARQNHHQPRRIQHYRGGGSQRLGGSTRAMVLTSVPEPDFSAHDLLKLNATKTESTALSLPIRSRSKAVAKTLQPESLEIDEDDSVQINLPDLPPSVLARPAPPFVCHCPCVVKAQGTSYSHQAQLTSGKFLDVNMKFFSEERTGHPLRTRIRVVVKLFKLRASVTRSYDKRKSKEDGKTIEDAFKTSLNEQTLVLWSEHNGQSHEERNDLDDSEASDLDESIFSDTASQTSSASEILSVSDISELPVELYKGHASPEDIDLLFHDADGVNSHLSDDLFEHAPSQYVDQDGELISSENEINTLITSEDRAVEVRDTTAFHKEDIEQEFEFSMDLDARTYMRGLSALTNHLVDFDAEEPAQESIDDPEQVFQYSFRFLLYVIFALSNSRNFSPSLLK